jgi:RNA polymerase sigma-70 factor (ECF subfamily)
MTKTNGFGTLAATKQTGTQDEHAELPHEGEADLLEHATRECPMVERAQAGDRAALETLLAAARPRLLSVALKMLRDPDDAEDVVQDAMMKVWRYVGRFEGRAALSTWLHRIVVNTALDHLRSKRVGPVAARATAGEDAAGEERHGPEAIDEHTPEDAVGSAQVGLAVREAMATLSPVHHQVLALREFEGESYEAIANIARCPVGTVMSRLHHARHRLAETLQSLGPEWLQQAA